VYGICVVCIFIGFGGILYLEYDINKRYLSLPMIFIAHLGEQSLFTYFLQILIVRLCAIFIVSNRLFVNEIYVLCMAFAIITICIVSSEIVYYLRRYGSIQTAYKILFA
jgi:hypothetical protein